MRRIGYTLCRAATATALLGSTPLASWAKCPDAQSASRGYTLSDQSGYRHRILGITNDRVEIARAFRGQLIDFYTSYLGLFPFHAYKPDPEKSFRLDSGSEQAFEVLREDEWPSNWVSLTGPTYLTLQVGERTTMNIGDCRYDVAIIDWRLRGHQFEITSRLWWSPDLRTILRSDRLTPPGRVTEIEFTEILQ